MHVLITLRVFLLFFLALIATTGVARELPHLQSWPHEGGDLASDPEITWGRLPNGMRYVLLPNATPKDRVSLRLLVSAGSLMERDDQRGLAHFLEHMAFQGSKDMPAGELVKYLERLGMAFGADTNARTSFDYTMYQLELPSNDQQLIERSLFVLRQTADQLLISADPLERERGVILSEERLRGTASYRSLVANLEFLFPGSVIPQRMPIGVDSIIQTAPRERFVEFYRTWYRPDRITLVVVGGFDLARLQELIGAQFGSFAPSTPAPSNPDLGEIRPRGFEARLHYDPEARTTVTLQSVRPLASGPDLRPRRVREMALYLAQNIVSRRLATLALQPDAPFQTAALQNDDLLEFARVGYFVVNCRPEQWDGALRVAEMELRRALTHGFTAAEIEEQRRNVLADFKERAQAATTRESPDLANQIVESLTSRRVFTNPEQDLEEVNEVLAGMTPQELLAAFRDQWGHGDPLVFVSGAVKLDDASNTIASVFRASQAQAVAPPTDNTVAQFAYTTFGESSAIAARTRYEPLDITQISYGNHVRLNLKPTQFEANTVLIAIRIGGGRLELPMDKPGLKQLADSTFVAGGLEKHSLDELNRIMSGRNVNVSFDVEDDAFTLSARTTPEDLAFQLQLLAAYVTAPGYRPEALRQFRDKLPGLYQNLDRTPTGVLQQKVVRYLRGGDPRFGYPDQSVLASRTLEELRGVLGQALATGYLEISIVGDFDLEKVVASVTSTFGSMSARAADKPAFSAQRQLRFPVDHQLAMFTYDTADAKALAGAYWLTTDFTQVSDVRRLFVLAKVLGGRLLDSIRNERGLTYSAQGDHAPSQTFTGYGLIYGMVDAPPAKAVELAEEIRRIGGELHANGVTADELERARNPVVNELKRLLTTNGYLLGAVVSGSQELPQKLERAQTSVREIESMSVEDLNAAARKYLAPESAVPVVIMPQPPQAQPKAEQETPLKAERIRPPLAHAPALKY